MAAGAKGSSTSSSSSSSSRWLLCCGVLPTSMCASRPATWEHSEKDFERLDVDGSKGVSKSELGTWIHSHAELWAMLSVNLDITEEACRGVATDVAFQLATAQQQQQVGETFCSPECLHFFRVARAFLLLLY